LPLGKFTAASTDYLNTVYRLPRGNSDLGGMMFWELSGDDTQLALVQKMSDALID
jgi:hypothetical protein